MVLIVSLAWQQVAWAHPDSLLSSSRQRCLLRSIAYAERDFQTNGGILFRLRSMFIRLPRMFGQLKRHKTFPYTIGFLAIFVGGVLSLIKIAAGYPPEMGVGHLPTAEALSKIPEYLNYVGIFAVALVVAGGLYYRMTKNVIDYTTKAKLNFISALSAMAFTMTAVFPHMIIGYSGAGPYIMPLYFTAILLISFVLPWISGTAKKTWRLFVNEYLFLKAFQRKMGWMRLADEMPVFAKLAGVRGLGWIARIKFPSVLIPLLGSVPSQPLAAPLMYWAFSMEPKLTTFEWTIMNLLSLVVPNFLESLRGKKMKRSTLVGTGVISMAVAVLAIVTRDPTAVYGIKPAFWLGLAAAFCYAIIPFFINWTVELIRSPARKKDYNPEHLEYGVKAVLNIGYLVGLATVFGIWLRGGLRKSTDPILHIFSRAGVSSVFNAVMFATAWVLMVSVKSAYHRKKQQEEETVPVKTTVSHGTDFGFRTLLAILASRPVWAGVFVALILKRLPAPILYVVCGLAVSGIIIINFGEAISSRLRKFTTKKERKSQQTKGQTIDGSKRPGILEQLRGRLSPRALMAAI